MPLTCFFRGQLAHGDRWNVPFQIAMKMAEINGGDPITTEPSPGMILQVLIGNWGTTQEQP